MTALNLIAQGLTMLLPILISGIVLIIAMKRNWLAALNHPLDVGTGLFGPNKTVRGLVIHVVVATIVVFVLHAGTPSEWIAPQYSSDPLILGVAISGGYVAGELINSFIKRRLGIPAGARGGAVQRFFDNMDGALVSGVVLLFGYQVSAELLTIGFFLALGSHIATDALMRRLRLKNR